ncbi:MAG: aminotransferase class IV [Lutibacter sp.]|jgi:branched-chain amino acid aminotransferase|nr:aminotransferase class IV [Lutibacter sp.]
MINFNGVLTEKAACILTVQNRAFRYGDALFETLKVKGTAVCYLEKHYFRLMASMRMLRMEIPMFLTVEYFEEEILKTVAENVLKDARVRLTVFRNDGGLYKPENKGISYVVEVFPLNEERKHDYQMALYKDFYIHAGLLSTLKTTNRITNVLASIYADENGYDNCVLLNEHKRVVEAINGNIFIVKDKGIFTPPLSEGCVKGVMRAVLISACEKRTDYRIQEAALSPFDIQKADEIFITNAVIGIQPVTHYRKRFFNTDVSTKLFEEVISSGKGS